MAGVIACHPLVLAVSDKVTPAIWRGYVAEVRKAAEVLRGLVRPKQEIPIVVAFIDELNTAPTHVLAAIKECFVDRTFEGVPLPENIFWSGAINPPVIHYHASDADAEGLPQVPPPARPPQPQHVVDYTGVRNVNDTEDFIVHALPPSLKLQILDFDTLSTQQEAQFLTTLARDQGFGVEGKDRHERCEQALISIIESSQEFVREKHLWRVHVSIRDMMRVLQLYRTLLASSNRQVFLPPLPPDVAPGSVAATETAHWSAVIVAVAMAYMLRLPPVLRTQWFALVDELLPRLGCPPHLQAAGVFQSSIDLVFSGTLIPRGIAPTR